MRHARNAGGLATALILVIALAAAPAAPAAATTVAAPGSDADRPRLSDGSLTVFGGAPAGAAKTAATDTALLIGPWGSGAPVNGQFESPGGAPDWNGWTSYDVTRPTVTHWHADTYNAVAGSWSAWCGTTAYGACNLEDTAGGYGNDWDETLEWRGTVADPGLGCTVDVAATVAVDTEPGYDYAYVSAVKGGGQVDLWQQEGTYAGPVNVQTAYAPSDYQGAGSDEVVVRFRVTSDGGWSDQDCSYPSDGAFYVDDVVIGLSNGTGYSHDFEDGTLGALQPVLTPGVGNFASIRAGLKTIDNCSAANLSPMLNFVDDGVVVPGTGGTPCISWCYGPQGYIVNNTGGLAGPEEHLHNAVESPVIAWPGAGYDGGTLAFDVWRHETLAPGMPGIFFTWSVRATSDPDPATITDALWADRNFVYYGGPDWFRMINPVGDLIPADAQHVQVQLAVIEMGWVWGFVGTDGTPAPYFDNVRFAAYPHHGPAMSASVFQLPHDAFPENGTLDTVNLGANNVRFDSGQDITGSYDTANVAGDSIVIAVAPQRAGATLVGPPRLHYRLQRNPLFDAHRATSLPDEGYVGGWPVVNDSGDTLAGRFAFDLPDTGFLFPGDFLYYYFAADDIAGGEVQTATLPADTSGFGDFADPMAYPPIYKLHALPTLTEAAGAPGTYEQPTILFWDDAGAVGNRDEWYMAFRNLGLAAGVDYDIYYTSGPSAGSGHGLGGRATALQLAGYDDLLYTSGVQTANTLGDGPDGSSGEDPSDDVGVLEAWLMQGGKDMFLTGDDLAGDLARSAGGSYAFLRDWMGVDLAHDNVLDRIDLQTAPLVALDQGGFMLPSVDRWRGVASCLGIGAGYYGSGSAATGKKRYDGVFPLTGAVRLAEFLDPAGVAGQYTFSAATYHERGDHDARIVSLPYDFQSIHTDADGAKADAAPADRVLLLRDVLTHFGQATGAPSAVPGAGGFAAASFPNPFNPATTIRWSLPRAGHLELTVYDVRGRRVRTLVDDAVAAGPGEIRWDGRTTDGRAAAAGVYFYRLQADSGTLVGKMALIK